MIYNQELPKEVQKSLDDYLERVKAIKWFKPEGVKRATTDKQIKVALKCFGVEASIEYRALSTPSDWDAAWDAARDAAWDAARGAAWDAARGAAWDAARGAAWDAARDAARDAAWDAAWDAARGAAWDAARGAAWDAARGATDLLAGLTPEPQRKAYKEKYPDGNFLELIPLWEAGLYPVGVVSGKFVVYVPTDAGDVSDLLGKDGKKK
jgi:hypothetical protein